MSENCRKSCGACGKSRAQTCPGGKIANPKPAVVNNPTITPGSKFFTLSVFDILGGATASCTSPGCCM
jgi:hypothetical protein